MENKQKEKKKKKKKKEVYRIHACFADWYLKTVKMTIQDSRPFFQPTFRDNWPISAVSALIAG